MYFLHMISHGTLFVLLLCETIYTILLAYDLQCPESGQRNILNQRLCNKTHMYSCIFNENEAHYESTCQIPIPQRPGFKVTKLGGVYARQCPNDEFQPVKYWTNETSKCVFKKSLCSDEGSVLTNNGTTRTDVICRCDYTKGYNFINKPRDKCGCVPSEEDCSCFLMQCPGQQILSQGIFPATPRTAICEVVTRTRTMYASGLIPMLFTICVVMVLIVIFLVKKMGQQVEFNYQSNTSVRAKDNISNTDSTRMKNTPQTGEPIKPNVKLCQILLVHGASIDAGDKEKQTPLMHACNISDGKLALFLIKNGAIINSSDSLGNTPLILATQNGMVSVVTNLLESGAHVNAVNENGSAALSFACKNGSTEIVTLLLRHGSDPNISDNEGRTPLIQAVHFRDNECLNQGRKFK